MATLFKHPAYGSRVDTRSPPAQTIPITACTDDPNSTRTDEPPSLSMAAVLRGDIGRVGASEPLLGAQCGPRRQRPHGRRGPRHALSGLGRRCRQPRAGRICFPGLSLVLPPFSTGHVAFLCICLPCDFLLFVFQVWCLHRCFLPLEQVCL